ncbi:hypothetical protein GCM10010464_77920 [Pseudonocardia yunnanensis]
MAPTPAAGARPLTVVSDCAEHPAPSPRAVQLDEPVLSRTPVMSPDAEPDVVLAAEPRQSAPAHSTCAAPRLDALSSRAAGRTAPTVPSPVLEETRAALSRTSEADSALHAPADASQFDEPFVSRTGAAPPAVAAVPVTRPVVAVVPLPEHAGESPQSTRAPAELDAVAAPSVSTAGCTAPSASEPARWSSRSSTELSTSVLLFAPHAPPETSQVADPVLLRAAPSRSPLAVPPVLLAPVPVHPAVPSQSTSAVAALPPPTSATPSARDSLCVRQPPPVAVQLAEAFVAASGVPVDAGSSAAPAVALASRGAALRPASVLLVERPVQASSQLTSAPATTASRPARSPRSPRSAPSPRSTVLEVPHPLADSQCADPLPWPRDSPPVATGSVLTARFAAAPRPVAAGRASSRSDRDPVLLLSHTPPSVRHCACAPEEYAYPVTSHRPVQDADAAVFRCAPPTDWASTPLGPDDSLRHDPPPVAHADSPPAELARLLRPHPLASPEHFADAVATSPSALRWETLLPQPWSAPDNVHDAAPFDSPDEVCTPHPDDTPANATHRSESFSPSAPRLTEPHATNAPLDPHPAADPSPRLRDGTASDTSLSVAAISSSVASYTSSRCSSNFATFCAWAFFVTVPAATFFSSAANCFSFAVNARWPSTTSSTSSARSGDSSARSAATCFANCWCFFSSFAYAALVTSPEATFFLSAANAALL